MMQLIDIENAPTLKEYQQHFHLSRTVDDLKEAARQDARLLGSGKIWMVNSTAQGGGVAEMLPKLVAILRDLGIETEWAVVGGEDDRFFELTKRIHNMLHGQPGADFTPADRAVYEAASREAAGELGTKVAPNDIVIIHDPQPLGAGAMLAEKLGVRTIWRCHIGLDSENASTRAAWDFLRPWTLGYERVVFSFPEYVPEFLSDRAEIIAPAIDPLSEKNRDLSARKVAGVLINAKMDGVLEPVPMVPFEECAMRLQDDGTFAPADKPASIGLMLRPIVTQISRWDRLKGWHPLLKGFARMKAQAEASGLHAPKLAEVRLVLAGPDPSAIQDDPEGIAVFNDLCGIWQELPDAIRKDVVVLVLPMKSRAVNALMVNALQRCSSIVVQNSLQEGFGLTVTEGMWKQCPILGTHAVGIRHQVRDGVDGRLIDDPENEEEIALTMNEMLARPELCEEWGRNGQGRVAEHYLIFTQVRRWLSVLKAAA